MWVQVQTRVTEAAVLWFQIILSYIEAEVSLRIRLKRHKFDWGAMENT